jgi:hypothetical protein
VVRGVEDLGHLVVVDTSRVLEKGGVCVFMVEGFGLGSLLVSSALLLGVGSGWCEHVIIRVPSGRRELVLGRRVIELVEGVGAVSGSQIGSWSLLLRISPLFMLLRGWRL